MNPRQTRLALTGLALGVLLALVIAPQTRWLVRPQFVPSLISDAQSRHQFVLAHPNDYTVQLGAQPTDSAEYSRSLVPRFPDSPSLRANILRYETQVIVHTLNRPDSSGNFLSAKPDPPPEPRPGGPPPTPAQLAAFDADAAAGERLDPDNAYFPLMRAAGLFAAHRDAEGLTAVTRAGTKTGWREYYEDEVEGRWRILDGMYGHREAVASGAISYSLLFPHYQVLRAVARLVTVKAVKKEQAGHREEGLALRRSIARCGDLMRAEGTSLITNLVGISITALAQLRPGGAAPLAPPVGSDIGLSGDQRARQRLDAYCEYATKIGHPEAAREAQAQAGAGEQVRHLSMNYISGSRPEALPRLVASLVVGWVTATNLILLLLLEGTVWGLSRLPWIRERKPLPVGTTVGVWVVLFLSLFGVFLMGTARPEEVEGYVFMLSILLLVPLAAFTIYSVFQPSFRRPLGQVILAGLITVALLTVFVGLAAWEMRGSGTLIATANQTLVLSPDGTDRNSPTNSGIAQGQLSLVAFGITLPLLLAAIRSIAVHVKRVPASAGLVEGFRAWAPPLVCALAVLYCGLTLWTVRQESAVNYGLERSQHGEAQYVAELTGQPWPGPVR